MSRRGGTPPDLSAVAVPEIPRVLVPITLDAAGVQTYFGVSESMAAYIIRQMPRRIAAWPDGKRKVMVYTEDVLALMRRAEVAA